MVLYKMKDTFPVSGTCRNNRKSPTPQNTTVVVSRWDADTSWTRRLAEKGYRVCVYEHGTNMNNPFNLPANVGREASAYCKYICDYYDNLTLYTVFVHDHEFSWHHEGSLVDIITSKLTTLCSPGYINLNNRCTGSVYNDMWPAMKKFFDKYLAPYIGHRHDYGDWTLGSRCCAQFIVHRDRIHKHPKKMYADLYKFLITPRKSDPIGLGKGHLIEWTIQLIFDSPLMYPKNKVKKDLEKLKANSGGPCPLPGTGIQSQPLGMVV
jgi:hypothetical protein